ncbi:MAG: hypothetical protein H0T62_12705 [Parachlamydiaceae bacterium]|nr:hypothetical protein [Parachlamydiaceae bacterium]
MGIDLTNAAYRFNLVIESFKVENHQYLVIDRDANGSITGCSHTNNRRERASLLEINEFANKCFQQYNSRDDTKLNIELNTIKTGLEVISNQINEKNQGSCISGFWFWLQLGNGIVAASQEIIAKISKITESLIPTKSAESNLVIDISIQTLTKAKEYEILGQNTLALNFYKIASKNGNFEATNVLIECYETGKLDQVPNSKNAAKYYLKASAKYFELQDQNAFSNACRKAFEHDPEQALLHIIKQWGLNILTLFEKEEILKLNCTQKIVDAYALNAEDALEKGNSKQAMEQHNCIRPFDSLKASRILIEIVKNSIK